MENLEENRESLGEKVVSCCQDMTSLKGGGPIYNSPQEHGYQSPEESSFRSTYMCYPVSLIGNDHLEHGDQITMPQSVLDRLLDLHVDFPMLFEICNDSKYQTGKGTYVKLQPHSMDFMGILNPKAALSRPGHLLLFVFLIRTVRLKKGRGGRAKGGRGTEIIPFTGVARHLDEKPGAELASSSVQKNKQTVDTDTSMATESQFRSRKRPGKVVFGSSDAESKSKEPKNKIAKTETPKRKQFQPFTGKKHSLAG
ncbi:hypothetical protein RCOM_0413810 [Ricinus communis]|uniref:Ubiquitin fusion degradation protein UFD1 N-terminal subdomain 1 domain-containing protein n=1 Tax=Ricinus communis TaxID=3988 RepID=B9T276_RICCO|nr:hypothetical protein RCOM_0413810 [Ricinus communis]